MTSSDRAERLLLQAVIERADHIAHERMRALAIQINNVQVEAIESG